jgi:hypothetical protein
MSAPTLAQQLALWAWLDKALTRFRKDQLLPAAHAEMPPGARLPAMFGGRLAGWASMPKPPQRTAVVKDEAALLAWVLKNYPEKAEYVPEVIVDAALIEFLQEHRPQSLHVTERPDPQWTADICKALASDAGYYITGTGEKLTAVPGIEVPEPSALSPRVNLGDDGGEVIAEAVRSGEIDLRGVLALPAPQEAPDAA